MIRPLDAVITACETSKWALSYRKVQYTLYIAAREYAGIYNRQKLFSEDFIAASDGPTLLSVAQALRIFIPNLDTPIPSVLGNSVSPRNLTSREHKMVAQVARVTTTHSIGSLLEQIMAPHCAWDIMYGTQEKIIDVKALYREYQIFQTKPHRHKRDLFNTIPMTEKTAKQIEELFNTCLDNNKRWYDEFAPPDWTIANERIFRSFLDYLSIMGLEDKQEAFVTQEIETQRMNEILEVQANAPWSDTKQ